MEGQAPTVGRTVLFKFVGGVDPLPATITFVHPDGEHVDLAVMTRGAASVPLFMMEEASFPPVVVRAYVAYDETGQQPWTWSWPPIV